jgi:hypothetical protein
VTAVCQMVVGGGSFCAGISPAELLQLVDVFVNKTYWHVIDTLETAAVASLFR